MLCQATVVMLGVASRIKAVELGGAELLLMAANEKTKWLLGREGGAVPLCPCGFRAWNNGTDCCRGAGQMD